MGAWQMGSLLRLVGAVGLHRRLGRVTFPWVPSTRPTEKMAMCAWMRDLALKLAVQCLFGNATSCHNNNLMSRYVPFRILLSSFEVCEPEILANVLVWFASYAHLL